MFCHVKATLLAVNCHKCSSLKGLNCCRFTEFNVCNFDQPSKNDKRKRRWIYNMVSSIFLGISILVLNKIPMIQPWSLSHHDPVHQSKISPRIHLYEAIQALFVKQERKHTGQFHVTGKGVMLKCKDNLNLTGQYFSLNSLCFISSEQVSWPPQPSVYFCCLTSFQMNENSYLFLFFPSSV